MMELFGCNVIGIIPAGGTFRDLYIYSCNGLHTIRTQPSLLNLKLSNCPKLGALGSMPKLDELSIQKCPNLTSVGPLPELTTLHTNDYLADEMLFSLLDHLPLLDNLSIWSNRMTDIHTIPALHNLIELRIWMCPGLTELPTLTSLSKLEIWDCPDLSEVGSFPSLTTLSLCNTPLKDEVLYNLLNDHPWLNCISIICATMTNLSLEPQRLSSLRKLRLSCANLQYCDGLSGLTFLEEIKIWGCPKLPIHSLLPRQLQSALDLRDAPDHGEATSSTSATATRSTLARKDSGITSAAVSSSTLRVTTREHCRPSSTLSSRGSAASHGYSAASASTIRGGARGSCSSL
uniref:Leucine-rich repeat-containing N-terminal plant-type domain-containing protein n=1 Tax=Oryza glumipatula TaxID=40148 RepID=A0A0E0BJ72_9ORYZ